MSNKHNKKHPKATPKKENATAIKKPVTRNKALKISYLHFIPLGCALFVFMILWLKPFKVNLKDPWNEGAIFIDSANKITDVTQREILLEEARKRLVVEVKNHPYHARVHYMYGYYWFMKQNWDSAIFQQKEAIRIGAGGTVNQVEFAAQDILNRALGSKVSSLLNAGNLSEALKVLESAKTPEMYNPDIDKYAAVIYSRQGNIDSALASSLRYNASQPNNADNLANIAMFYRQKNIMDSALIYANQALRVDPQNANANLIKSQLNSQ